MVDMSIETMICQSLQKSLSGRRFRIDHASVPRRQANPASPSAPCIATSPDAIVKKVSRVLSFVEHGRLHGARIVGRRARSAAAQTVEDINIRVCCIVYNSSHVTPSV